MTPLANTSKLSILGGTPAVPDSDQHDDLFRWPIVTEEDDVDPHTLCLDPNDIERHIGPRTKAIMVVHYCGHPADMDPIMETARAHNLDVIEDVSHAQGALYKGRLVGTFGRVAALSMMTLKSFAIGEGGMLIADDDPARFDQPVPTDADTRYSWMRGRNQHDFDTADLWEFVDR